MLLSIYFYIIITIVLAIINAWRILFYCSHSAFSMLERLSEWTQKLQALEEKRDSTLLLESEVQLLQILTDLDAELRNLNLQALLAVSGNHVSKFIFLQYYNRFNIVLVERACYGFNYVSKVFLI